MPQKIARCEERLAASSEARRKLEEWTCTRSVVMAESLRQTGDSVSLEKRYCIRSLEPDSEKLEQAIRNHREIENRLHWCLDVTFHEDVSRVRKDHAPANLNIARKSP